MKAGSGPSRPTVGIATTWYERGAAYVSRQYRQLLEPTFNVLIYARGQPEEVQANPEWDGAYVTYGKKCLVPVATAIDRDDFVDWLASHRVRIVFFNEQHWWPPVVWCRDMGIATGAYVDYYTEETVPLFAAYDFLICNTLRHYRVFSWHPQCYYVPWGVDLDQYRPGSGSLVRPGVVSFFHSAGWSPYRKGTDLAIRAFASISGSARLIVHTQVGLEECLPEVAELIRTLSKDGRLLVIERTVSAPGLYHVGDVYVYPSRLEGIGLTIAEALACGLQVITTDNPPMNEFVTQENGRLVRVAEFRARSDGYYWPQAIVDFSSLAECLQYYVSRAGELPSMKEAARRSAEQRWNWRDRRRSLIEIFSNVRCLPRETKRGAIEAALAYEARRTGFRLWLATEHPLVYAGLRWLGGRLSFREPQYSGRVGGGGADADCPFVVP